jgi:hypothetical protein
MTTCCTSAAVHAVILITCLFAATASAAIQIPEGGYLAAEHHDDLVMAPDGITIEGWFYLDEYPAEGPLFAPLVVKPGSYAIALVDRPKIGMARVIDPGPYVQLQFYDHRSDIPDAWMLCDGVVGRSATAIPDTNPVPAAEWMHVAFEMVDFDDGGALSYYLNGVRLGEKPESWVDESRAPFCIGGVPIAGPCLLGLQPRSWPGKIDAVRVSRGVRYGADVFAPERDLRVDRDTIALWAFDGPAATYEDLSGNGHTLSAVGSLRVSPQSKLATTWAALRLP